MIMPSKNKLNEIFEYCENSGILRWKHDRGFKVKAGDIAGSVFKRAHNKKPYRQVSLDKMVYRVHRVIWKMLHGIEPEQIDHEDGNGLNNKIGNLRACTNTENRRNIRLFKSNTSGCSGVRLIKSTGKWIAIKNIMINGKRKERSLGCFVDYFDAVCARKSWQNHAGYHKNHGMRREL